MSSSKFIENSATAKDGKEDKLPDSNLVVVYGKNGVNIDPKDLETLIEEKAVKTISVIRISSPTPSMEEAEEAERLEAAKEAIEETENAEGGSEGETADSKKPESTDVGNNNNNNNNNESSNADSEEEDEENSSGEEENDENTNEESTDSETKLEKSSSGTRSHGNRRTGSLKKKHKSKSKKQESKQNSQVMGLTLEGFYEAEAALEIAKEACKMAGIPYIRNTAEYQFMLRVIKNDHCYTPYTSAEEMKEKLAAEKLESEKLAASVRKIQPQILAPSKQAIIAIKKLPITSNMNKVNIKKFLGDIKSSRIVHIQSNIGSKVEDGDRRGDEVADLKPQSESNVRDGSGEEIKDDDEETFELIDVDDSEYSGSDQSGDTDNDRDSDLDFNVHRRQTKKRRAPLVQKKTRRLTNAKINDKRDDRSLIEEAAASTALKTASRSTSEITTNTLQRQVLVKSRGLSNNVINSSPQTISSPMGKVQTVQAAGGSGQTFAEKVFTKPSITSAIPLRSGHIVQIRDNSVTTGPVAKAVQPTTQPAVKEIVINKVLSSPKGCFTELTTLISEAEKTSANQIVPPMTPHPATPTASLTRNIVTSNVPTPPSRSCFMRIDATGKNTLPSQISVETHQSSSELLAAEHDKQLDLIDSIVTDELNKSLENISEKPSISTDENIPKLVQMLENTEKALESNSLPADPVPVPNSLENCMPSAADDNTNVDDIDISHDLPEDLLQHVVELIKDDKTLQEAVEKEILEQESNFVNDALNSTAALTQHQMQNQQPKIPTSSSHSNFRNVQTLMQQPIPRTPPTTPTYLPTSTSKSIIQMSISNTASSSPAGITTISSGQTRSSPLARRDPIQIVRGNGRVITLPPIEAPTTRAKRRALVIPGTGQQSVENSPQMISESSLDNSLQSNVSFSSMSTPMTPNSIATGAGAGSGAPVVEAYTPASIEKKARETSAKRRISKEGSTTSLSKSTKRSSGGKSKRNTTKLNNQDETEASESQGDDDDPKRLWCICRQPHNNRFMICCDACSDWFHGTCVNVTKAMGREMEQKGLEWTCPNCVKKREERTQRKLTDMLQVRPGNPQMPSDEKIKTPIDTPEQSVKRDTTTIEHKKIVPTQKGIVQTPISQKTPVAIQSQKKVNTPLLTNSTGSQIKRKIVLTTPIRVVSSISNTVTKQTQAISTMTSTSSATLTNSSTTSNVSPTSLTSCVLCKKQGARPNSVYCSDDCIRRSAQNAINAYTAKSMEQTEASINNSIAQDEKKKKSRGLFEDLLSMADRKPKIERIVVYDRKSGTKLAGSNAPTTLTIKKWLHDNPSFEIVLPGSQLSVEIEKQQHRSQTVPKLVGQIRTLHPKAGIIASATNRINVLSQTPVNQNQISSTTKDSSGTQSIVTVASSIPGKLTKQVIEEHKTPNSSSSSPRPSTPRQLQKYPQHVQIRPDTKSPRNDTKDESKSKERQLKRQSSDASAASGSGGTNSGSSGSAKKSTETGSPGPAAASSDTEPIRKNVRRTLRDQLLQRMNETPITSSDGGELKLTPQEVEEFVKETEAEMFNMFNRETGVKYKAKYRSLIFNIKDRKNHTLFAKICTKQIEPKQLVHMSPEELASQELAQWRQNENKHQLEMIKKSELDLLSCTKNYLFKNHKGEEVIENKQSDVCVNLDMTIPVEDVVNVLNNSGSSEIENGKTPESSNTKGSLKQEHVSPQLNSSNTDVHEPHITEHHHHRHQHQHQHQNDQGSPDERSKISHSGVEKERESRGHDRRHRSRSHDSERERHHRSKSKDSKEFEKDRDRDRERERERERGRERHNRSRDRHHRDKSRTKRRSHSRSKSRGRSEEKRHKEHREDRRDREKDRDREERERKEKKNSSNKSNSIEHVKTKEKHRNSPIATSASSATKQKQQIHTQKSGAGCFNLIDQIIESSKTVEEAANLVRDSKKEKDKPKEPQCPVIATSSTNSMETITSAKSKIPTHVNFSTADSDQEPSSTVSIPTPPHDPYPGEGEEEEASFSRSGSPTMEATQIWSGGLVMNEVATLQIRLHHQIGNSRNIGKYLGDFLDVVGRIDNETVWEYLSKIRNSPNKEIVLLRIMPYGSDDTDAYGKLFHYLDVKKRLGVIKSNTPQIKDFYFFPLRSGKQLPKVLQVMNHEEFNNDPHRPDMIIGIIVRVLGKRTSAPNANSNPVTVSSTSAKHARRTRNEADSFTPPGSPKRRKRAHKGDIDVDAIIKAPIVARKVQKPTIVDADADEPYSPGGSSDDDVLPQYAGKSSSSSSFLLGLPTADEDLKRKMEEINRQIAAQEMEIAGLLNVEPNASASVLANISIPSNLPQILASIKSKDAPGRGNFTTQSIEEYNPEESMRSTHSSSARHSINPSSSSSTSRLAQLSEAELLSMVPDDILLEPAPMKKSTKPNVYQEPPPPGV